MLHFQSKRAQLNKKKIPQLLIMDSPHCISNEILFFIPKTGGFWLDRSTLTGEPCVPRGCTYTFHVTPFGAACCRRLRRYTGQRTCKWAPFLAHTCSVSWELYWNSTQGLLQGVLTSWKGTWNMWCCRCSTILTFKWEERMQWIHRLKYTVANWRRQ